MPHGRAAGVLGGASPDVATVVEQWCARLRTVLGRDLGVMERRR